MKYTILEKSKGDECFKIDLSDDCFKKLKTSFDKFDKFEIDFDSLNLGTKLYGKDQLDTKAIQKSNYRQMLQLYRLSKRVVKFLRKKKDGFDGTFYVSGLSDKKNNNDLMLMQMLELRFNVRLFQKTNYAIEFVCDYIDKENSLNKMCGDFKENKCRKQQENNLEKVNGCCVNPCKYRRDGQPCPVKCLSCKLFMCSFLERQGYKFYINYLPILRLYLSFFERFVLLGCLFRSEKQTLHYLLFIRFIYSVFILMVFMLAVILGAVLGKLII